MSKKSWLQHPPRVKRVCTRIITLAGAANGTSKNLALGKILAASRNIGSIFDKSLSLVFAWFVFTFFESRNFLPNNLGLRFLTRILASWRVSDFTIHHPYLPPSHCWVVSHTNPCQPHSQGSTLNSISLGRDYIRTRSLHNYNGLITMFAVVTQLRLYRGTTNKLFHCVDVYYLLTTRYVWTSSQKTTSVVQIL